MKPLMFNRKAVKKFEKVVKKATKKSDFETLYAICEEYRSALNDKFSSLVEQRKDAISYYQELRIDYAENPEYDRFGDGTTYDDVRYAEAMVAGADEQLGIWRGLNRRVTETYRDVFQQMYPGEDFLKLVEKDGDFYDKPWCLKTLIDTAKNNDLEVNELYGVIKSKYSQQLGETQQIYWRRVREDVLSQKPDMLNCLYECNGHVRNGLYLESMLPAIEEYLDKNYKDTRHLLQAKESFLVAELEHSIEPGSTDKTFSQIEKSLESMEKMFIGRGLKFDKVKTTELMKEAGLDNLVNPTFYKNVNYVVEEFGLLPDGNAKELCEKYFVKDYVAEVGKEMDTARYEEKEYGEVNNKKVSKK